MYCNRFFSGREFQFIIRSKTLVYLKEHKRAAEELLPLFQQVILFDTAATTHSRPEVSFASKHNGIGLL